MALDFRLPTELEAHEPPEARGLTRDAVRLLVGRRDSGEVTHHCFTDLPDVLEAGDVLVVNTSGTMPAAVDILGRRGDDDLVLHVSTELPHGEWVVELRRREPGGATGPYPDAGVGERFTLAGGAHVRLVREYSPGRLWVARLDVPSVPGYLMAHGRPIRYGYVNRDWPLSTYRSVFATAPGSAEMPSASRPFTDALVTRLVSRGIVFTPITLHTGVASPEAHEKPYPERYRVPETTARLVNEARAAGRRIIGVGTTAVRAIETAADDRGRLRAASGWTSLVVTPERGVRAIDGLVTGFHEPRASHLQMLTAISGERLLADCYAEALRGGYLWHEFGDINLLLPR
ncbi:MAG TPA: S-adenosylmethionine:tRNA ribosyltransferase-isomerase [Micromonosporaceae bacterium]|nr:S-adenosylmethionine:tRNA ribosyltransferase-isomerase [Micromonosporaceae bacterium]